MFGGRDGAYPPNRFDELWILSLPSFTWTNVVQDVAVKSPLFSHTCHSVGNRTMVVVGGVEDFPQEGQQGSRCDWATDGIRLYDMSDLLWNFTRYNATPSAYEVPAVLISTIGGR